MIKGRAAGLATPHPVLRRFAAGEPVEPTEIDEAVVGSAIEHRVDTFLRRALEHGPQSVERGAQLQLEVADMAWRHRRAQILSVAAGVGEALTAAGIEHVFFKGIAEANRLYHDPTLRKFVDVDIILRPGTPLSEAVATLDADHPHLASIRSLDKSGILPTVDLFVDGVSVDIHLDPFRIGPAPKDADSWWDYTTVGDVAGLGRVRVLDDPLAFATFVLHQGRDRFRYLLGAVEFAAWMERGVDWACVRRIVEPEGTWDELLAAVEVLDSIEGRGRQIPTAHGWRRGAWLRMWRPEVILAGPAGKGRQGRRGVWLMPLLSRGRFWPTAVWIARSAVPPSALLEIRHPHIAGPYLRRLVLARLSILRQWLRNRFNSTNDTRAELSSPLAAGAGGED